VKKEINMERRKILKIIVGTSATIAGVGVVGYYALDRIFNPKTPLSYNYPEITASTQVLSPTLECKGHNDTTLAQTEGPYYTPTTPHRNNLIEIDTVGEKLLLEGFVLDTECKPVAGAVLDFWSCDGNGDYDNDGMKLRGHQFTDANGYYRLETVKPSYYAAGPFGSRTAHIHAKIQGKHTKLLTTQLYFPGEELNTQDGIFHESLLVKMEEPNNSQLHAKFNFVLAEVS
jgi:protocatechuate 3,4-dioxygenase beta subunit